MKNRVPIITTCLIGAGLLAVATFVSVGQNSDPAYTAHSAHVAADASQAGGQNIEAQLAEILARLERLEANTQQQDGQQQYGRQQNDQQQQFAQQQHGQSPPSGGMPMGAGNPPRMKPMPGMESGAQPMQGGMSGMGRGPALADQMAELRAKMQRLEATMHQQSGSSSGAMSMSGQPDQQPGQSPVSGTMGMGAGNPPRMRPMPGMDSGMKPMPGKMAGMSGMGAPDATKPPAGMNDMGGGAPPSGGEMGMTGMMDKMKSMMDKMMGGGAMPAAAQMEGSAPGGKMGMMDMDKMEMAGMMGKMGGMDGKGGSRMTMPSALPGFPGASHLYHVGATDFFLDHPQCITLSTEQQMMLNQIKEQAALDKTSADRSVQEAEQDLWTLTAADQPDNAQIEAKVAEIEKLKGDARLRFIGAIGEAANILNDGQRKSLTGFAPPAPVNSMATPAVAMPAAGMSHM